MLLPMLDAATDVRRPESLTLLEVGRDAVWVNSVAPPPPKGAYLIYIYTSTNKRTNESTGRAQALARGADADGGL